MLFRSEPRRIFRLTARDIPLDRGGLFKFGNFENRKGAAKPRPLCTPLGLFLGVLGCGGVRLLTCVCMLRCWMCEVEPMYVDADGEARCCRLVERV